MEGIHSRDLVSIMVITVNNNIPCIRKLLQKHISNLHVSLWQVCIMFTYPLHMSFVHSLLAIISTIAMGTALYKELTVFSPVEEGRQILAYSQYKIAFIALLLTKSTISNFMHSLLQL